MTKENRRSFLKKSVATAAGLSMVGIPLSSGSYRKIIGANDRINIGIVGSNRRARGLRNSFIALKDWLNIMYVADVVKERRENYADSLKEPLGYRPDTVNDFSEILADSKIDAIFNLTPDHWHAPGTWMALEAGKHVYVEKPLTHNPRENELLIKYQGKYDRVVQMGNQQRSQFTAQKIIREIHGGLIGEPFMVLAYYSNQRGSIGRGKIVPVPEGFDWDLFQGPAPREVFKDIYFDYNWHWFWPWGTGETGNNATHELDIARWVLKVQHPEEVIVNGGKFNYIDDDWTMYDTMDVTFRYPGNKLIRWDGKSRTNYQTYGSDRGNIVYGSEGTVTISRNGFRIYNLKGELLREERESAVSETTGLGGGGRIDTNHVLNFIEAIKGKVTQNSELEEAARSTHLCHLANISYRSGKILACNPGNGYILDQQIMDQYWGREYEPGWGPELSV